MTTITRRTALTGAAAAALLSATMQRGLAASYPEKPIRTIIPIAPGGQTDVLVRLLQMVIDREKLLPQPLVIVNNAAAGGTAGTRLIRGSEPDGYTIGAFHMGLLTAPAMGVVDYDHTAFEMIGQVARTPIGLGVTSDSRFKTIRDLMKEAKEKPDSVRVAMNIGLLPHFVPLMFQQDAGVQFRYVQTGGGAVRLKSLLGGHTDTSIFASSEFVLYKDQGIRPLVMFTEERVADLPDVPTARELGYNTVFEERVMMFAPKGTPADRIGVVAKALETSLNDQEVVDRLKALGVERQFIPGEKLRTILDQLKGPIARVGEEVKKAQAANKP